MVEVETLSWVFVYRTWNKLRRMPIPDKGFEQSFREYIYRKIEFDKMSDVRDTGLGLSYSTFSGVPHELDTICVRNRDLFIFELKHYEVSEINKEIIFTFLGKVMDFYLKNAKILSNYRVTMLFVTINRNIDDSIRKLCIAFGIKLIEPSLMTMGTLDYFAKDLYQKIPRESSKLKSKVENLIDNISELKNIFDYSFSEFFTYENGNIQIESTPLSVHPNPDQILDKIKEYYGSFTEVFEEWKLERD